MATSDNDIFYLLGDNTLGGDDDSTEYEVWLILVDGLYWHVTWNQDDCDKFIKMNDKPGAPAKLMYNGTVKPVG